MSMHLQMIQVARLASGALGDSAPLVRDFLLGSQLPDGGFKDRSGRSDLYYTVFGLDSLRALETSTGTDPAVEAVFDRSVTYLSAINPESLDFIHLCCFARCWAVLRQWKGKELITPRHGIKLPGQLAAYRSDDGGFALKQTPKQSTVYANFLGYGAYQDLQEPCPDALKLIQSFKRFETADGAWANEPGLNIGATNATAAAVTVLAFLGMPLNVNVVSTWLLARAHPQGGFCANPQIQYPDLLSTATALHALSAMQVDIGSVRERCMDFLDSLWTNEGSFHGHWGEELLDTEYTFYGLLALGHLAVGERHRP